MIENGIDRIKEYSHVFRNKRVGLITNPSGVDRNYRSSVDILCREVRLTALFGPEHGINGGLQAGAHADDAMNEQYGIPEYSLYGSTPRLTAGHLEKVDLVAFDIQDIGSRFYTYIYTLSDAMEDCARAGIPLVVFDRINPIGGNRTEGIMLRPGYESFIGRYPLPVRHGLTVGEFAMYINDRFKIGCDLTVIPCRGWKREMMYCDSGLGSWLNPSPNIPSMEAAIIYNGTCFFQETNMSEGRGTTRPFEMIGAPFLDPERLVRELATVNLPGAVFRPCCFIPTFSKFKGEICKGIQVHLTDCRKCNGFDIGLRLFDAIRKMTPEFKITNESCLDRHFGDNTLRLELESIDSLIERGHDESEDFIKNTASRYYMTAVS